MKATPPWGFFASAVLLLLASSAPVYGVKVWTNSLSGFWQDRTNWLQQSAPELTSSVQITNDVTKTITLNELTPVTNLSIVSLLLNAPPGATNTLLLSNVGATNPLTMNTGLELQDGADLRITNSALLCQLTNDHVNIDGSMTLDSGSIDFGDTTVTARVGRVTSGVLTINGGLVSAGAVTIGGLVNSSGMLAINGGQLNVSSFLSIGRNPATVGTFSMAGGQLNVLNDDTKVGDGGVGQMSISNATAVLTNLSIGHDTSSSGTLTIQNGALLLLSNNIAIATSIQSTGAVSMTGGRIAAAGQKIRVGAQGQGQFLLSGGTVETGDLWISAEPGTTASGTFTMTGGSVNLASSLLVGSSLNSAGQFSVSGGDVTVTNSTAGAMVGIANGSVTMNAGSIVTDNLTVTNTTGQFVLNGGTLSTKATIVANGAPFVVGDGSNAATLYLNGGTHSFLNGLVISSNAVLAGCGTIIGSVVNHGLMDTNCGSVIAPSITTPPHGEAVSQGSNFTFTVTASGTQPLSYQWCLAGTRIAGATASAYSKANALPADAGNYTVVITNSAGSITSPPALLQVLVPLPLTFQGRSGTTNTISFQSALGTTYTLQFKNSLTDTSWTDIPPSTNGTGTTILLRDTTASRSSRFYRLLLQ
jgi:hypothetical protein